MKKSTETGRLCVMCGKYIDNRVMKAHVVVKHKMTMEEYNDKATTKVDRKCLIPQLNCTKEHDTKVDPHQLEQILAEIQEENETKTMILIYDSFKNLTKTEYNLLKNKAKAVIVII
jgi:tRNA G37 N-methylase TrmD